MSLLDTIKADGAAAISAVQHGAAWLVGAATEAQQDVAEMEKDSPLVQAAVTAALGAAREHGIPAAQITTTAEDVLALAKAVAAGGSATPAAPEAQSAEPVAAPVVTSEPAQPEPPASAA